MDQRHGESTPFSETEPGPARTPSPRQVVGILLLLLGVWVLAGSVVQAGLDAVDVAFDARSQLGFAASAVLQGALTLAVLAWGWRRWRLDARATFALRPCRAPSVYVLGSLALLAIGVLTSAAVAELAEVVAWLDPTNLSDLIRGSRYTGGLTFVAFALAVTVAPAVTEELLFRGFVLSGLRRRLGTSWAVGVSGLGFALVHIVPIHIALTLPAGLFLGYLVVRTGSLYPAIVAHAVNNLWATVEAALWQASRPDLPPEAILAGASYPPVMFGLAAGVAIIGLVGIHRQTHASRAEGP